MTPRGWPLLRHFSAPPNWELLVAFSLKWRWTQSVFNEIPEESGKNVVFMQHAKVKREAHWPIV
jgi:hypothetical protein